MQVSLKPRMELRTKIGKIAAAVGFALLISSFAAGPVRADGDDNRGGDRDRGSYQHRDNDNRDYRGGNNYAYQQQPDYYYYAPQPNYYAAPDPYYYGSDRGYSARSPWYVATAAPGRLALLRALIAPFPSR